MCVCVFGARFWFGAHNLDSIYPGYFVLVFIMKASFWEFFVTYLWEINFLRTKNFQDLFLEPTRFLINCWVWEFLIFLILKILLPQLLKI